MNPNAPLENSYVCEMCGGVYFPSVGQPGAGIPPGTGFADLPEDWVCPVCTGHRWDFGHGATGISLTSPPAVEGVPGLAEKSPAPDPRPIWTRYLEARERGTALPIPDFSYAGYRGGLEPIPPMTGERFDVTRFGARADGTGDCRLSVEAAIAAAEKAGGGIVYFPPGRYRFNSQPGETRPIRIQGAGISLAGAGEGQSTLFMEHHMIPPDPFYKWLIAPLFQFSAVGGPPGKKLGRVVGDLRLGETRIEMEGEGRPAPGDVVLLYCRNPLATGEFLCGREPWSIWSTTVEKGPVLMERHRIASVEGNRVRFQEPVFGTFLAAAGVEVWTQEMVPGWRVEDLTFEGNWRETIVHHKNYIHDSGWTMVEMVRGLDPVVRHCTFRNVNVAAVQVACMNGTVDHCTATGNPGHCLWGAMSGSFGTLITRCVDATDGGQWHGPAASKGSTGTVIHRYRGQVRSGPDFHGSWPRGTLIDASMSGMVGVGGHYRLLPNHGPHCIWWNHHNLGSFDGTRDFWEPRKGAEKYSEAKISGAWVIGFHGEGDVSFRPESLALLESQGKAVEVPSLYEAQLSLRRVPGT